MPRQDLLDGLDRILADDMGHLGLGPFDAVGKAHHPTGLVSQGSRIPTAYVFDFQRHRFTFSILMIPKR